MELEEDDESSLSYNSPVATRGATGAVTDRLDEVFHEEEEEDPGQANNSFFLVVKIIDLPGGQINDPSSGKNYFLPFLPSNSLVFVSDP